MTKETAKMMHRHAKRLAEMRIEQAVRNINGIGAILKKMETVRPFGTSRERDFDAIRMAARGILTGGKRS